LFGYNGSSSGYLLWLLNGAGNECYIDSSGNLNCSGSKNAVVPVDGGKRTVAMSAIEAPQNWFEDAGSSRLTNGAAVVSLDMTFTHMVNAEKEYQVFLTAYGDCKGLCFTDRTPSSFTVHELGGGTAKRLVRLSHYGVAEELRKHPIRRSHQGPRARETHPCTPAWDQIVGQRVAHVEDTC